MNKNVLLFDFIKGEIIEMPIEREIEIIKEKHEEYKDAYIVFGRDYFNGYTTWFIKDIYDTSVSRLSLEERVNNYLMRK